MRTPHYLEKEVKVIMTEKERMIAGKLYDPMDGEILKEQFGCLEKMYEFNRTTVSEPEKRQQLMKEMFGQIGKGCYIEPPFYANWGGKHVFLGDYVYANFNLTMTDDGNIYVGDHVMIGPNVTVSSAGHPVELHLRKQGIQFNADVHIGNNVWIGAGCVILPGVSIGEDSVIGAGSIVTKDIPSGVVAVGNPCRVMRAISERDRNYYIRNKEIDMEIPD